jgi:hypothetical protein
MIRQAAGLGRSGKNEYKMLAERRRGNGGGHIRGRAANIDVEEKSNPEETT